LHSITRIRAMRACIRYCIAVCMGVMGFTLVGMLLFDPQSARATTPADIATSLPAPPTDVPAPTNVPAPPTDVPAPTNVPLELPPTDMPATDVPVRATDAPPTATPRPRTKTRREPDPSPTAETVLPSPTPPPRIDIAIHKGVSVGIARPGEAAVYSLEITNMGDAEAYDVIVSDRVSAMLEVIDLSSSKGDIVTDGQGQVMAYPAVLAPGEQAIYRITVRVRPNAAAGVVVNRADITTSTPGDDPHNNTSTIELLIEIPPTVVPPTAAPPASAPPVPPLLPPTSDPTAGGIIWQLLPWALLALAVVGVGGLLTYSIVGVQTLSEQVLAFMSHVALTPVRPVVPHTAPERDVHAHISDAAAAAQVAQAADLPPLGPLFAAPPPCEPLPPLVPLDRETALRPPLKEK